MIDQMANWLRSSDDVIIIGHVNPDGDTAGSCMALKLCLEALGKRACVYLPGQLPDVYGFLPFADDFIYDPSLIPFTPQFSVAVDVSEAERMGPSGISLFESCAHRAVIDHHPTNDGFGQINLIDGERTATGELILELIQSIDGAEITNEIAQWLFVSISTDSGNFSYSNTTADALCAAAMCVAYGANVADITKDLYRSRTFGKTRLLGLALSNIVLLCDGKVAYTKLTDQMFADAGARREDTEGIVNYLIEITGVKVAILAEQRGKSTKFSLRCIKPLDVARNVAVPLGGGGHDCAAGLTLDMDIVSASDVVLDKVYSILK